MDYKLVGAIFLEGVLSFLSPCVLPLIPLYLSYLAGDSRHTDEEGNVTYDSKQVFLRTLFFVGGISCTFAILGFASHKLSNLLTAYREIIAIIGGTLLIIFGLHEIGIINIEILSREWKIRFDSLLQGMNHFKAFLFGFLFSFGWSPCIGPMLANALLLASVSNDPVYILIYAIGMLLPFLLTGLFSNKAIRFLSEKKKYMKYVTVIAGIIMLLSGGYMIHDASRTIIAGKTLNGQDVTDTQEESDIMDHFFKTASGKEIALSDYKGQYVFLNFSTTWCTYCQAEIPELEEFAENNEIQCFYVMSPQMEYHQDDIEKYLEENDLKIEVIIDEEAALFYYCGVNSYPTSFIISPDNEFLTYANGALSLDGFNQFFDYSKSLYEEQAEGTTD
ncbi:MAG: redoxin domain-containing protein [Erysipelotrichaceae bacterium]|nr:redoxin domain-containing protein [Erysipelotrichaceae bacterium]